MRLVLAGRLFVAHVHYQTTRSLKVTLRSPLGEWQVRRCTLVSLHEGECLLDGDRDQCHSTSSAGVAVCNPKDQYKKDAGRKVALLRAMKGAGLAKGERTDLWESYHLREGARPYAVVCR